VADCVNVCLATRPLTMKPPTWVCSCQGGVLFDPGRLVRLAAVPVQAVGPLLMPTGASRRARFHFFHPDQLAAYERHPILLAATAYGLFATAPRG
jgi:hypothetical protein